MNNSNTIDLKPFEIDVYVYIQLIKRLLNEKDKEVNCKDIIEKFKVINNVDIYEESFLIKLKEILNSIKESKEFDIIFNIISTLIAKIEVFIEK